jgi:hypothetical protein
MYDASQFGQLNRLIWDFSICRPSQGKLGSGVASCTGSSARKNRLPYFQAAREQPVTLALLPVDFCEIL